MGKGNGKVGGQNMVRNGGKRAKGQKCKRAKGQKGKRAKGQRQIRKANHKPLWKIRIGVLSEETLKFFPGFGNFENCLLG